MILNQNSLNDFEFLAYFQKCLFKFHETRVPKVYEVSQIIWHKFQVTRSKVILGQ